MSAAEQAIVMWAVVAAAFVIGEMLTMALVSLYFGLGAVAGAIAASLGGGTVTQMLTFGIVSLVLMAATRPLIARKLQTPTIESNVHSLVGKRGIVMIEIDNDSSTGQIRVGTEFWTARAEADGVTFPIDSKVEIVKVSGVTALVRAIDS